MIKILYVNFFEGFWGLEYERVAGIQHLLYIKGAYVIHKVWFGMFLYHMRWKIKPKMLDWLKKYSLSMFDIYLTNSPVLWISIWQLRIKDYFY